MFIDAGPRETPRSLLNQNQKRRRLRGGHPAQVSRAMQDISLSTQLVVAATQGRNNTTLSVSSSDSAGMSTEAVESDGSNLIVSILCLLIISPVFLACIGQLIYTCHRRKRARLEQQLLAVSTNPTSRMLILSEILKNDCRPVTKDQASSKKSRVLVKKYRKKTPLEQQQQQFSHSNDEIMETTNLSDESRIHKENDRILVSATNYYLQDNHDTTVTNTSWDEENPTTTVKDLGRNVSILSGNAVVSNTPTTIVYFLSDDTKYRRTSLELDNVSTLEEEEEEEDTSSRDCISSSRADREEKLISRSAPVESYPTLDTSIVNDLDDETKEDIIKCDTTDCFNKSKSSDILCPTENKCDGCTAHDDRVTHYSNGVPQYQTNDSSCIEIQVSVASTSVLHSPLDTTQKQQLPPLMKVQELSLSMGESDDVPKIPLLNIFVTTPKKYPSRRGPTSDSILTESSAIRELSGIHNVPDLDDDDDDDVQNETSVSEFKSIFRNGPTQDITCVGDMSELHTCGSSDTEVASNIEELKGHNMDSFVVESPRNAHSPFQQYLTGSQSIEASNEWSIPLQKVESYKSSTDYSLSSNISYFSYEDVSIASDELDTCAICLCPYEEGDIRIFSKRCPHAFHKQCILEWLVKSQNCPCCRIDIVTKSEIDEISAALIGTKLLAEVMQEAPPFSVRRSRLARQLMARARVAQRLRNFAPTVQTPTTAAHATPRSSPSPISSMSPLTPRAGNITHSSRDRFLRATNGFISPPSPSFRPQVINPSRSSDAIMNPNEANQMNTAPSVTSGGGEASIHTSNAGSLFTTNANQSMFHDHWNRQSRQAPEAPPPPYLSSPSTTHPYWRQSRFVRASSGFLSPPSPAFEPSRSSDDIMNPHEANQLNTAPSGGGEASIHTSNAGSLFTTNANQSMFHDHWIRQSRQAPEAPPPPYLSAPSTTHPYWRQSRFVRASSGFLSPPSPTFERQVINPSRSLDAVMNPHEANQLNTAPSGGGEASIHNSYAGSLFTTNANQSMFHDHWILQSRQTPVASPPPMNLTLSSPSTTHPYWRQSRV